MEEIEANDVIGKKAKIYFYFFFFYFSSLSLISIVSLFSFFVSVRLFKDLFSNVLIM